MINRVKLADAIKYIEHQIKDTEYFMIEPLSFLKEAIKLRKVIPLFYFDGHATITEADRTRFKEVRQTMKLRGYFTVPQSLIEYESAFTNYGVKLDETSITISQAIVYELDFLDIIQFTAPFQKGEFIEPNFHDHIQIEKNDLLSLYRYKPFLDDMEMYYASDSYPENRIYDEIEVKTDDLHFEFSHLKALFSIDDKGLSVDNDKIPAPTVTQTEPPNKEKLTKELAAAKAKITSLKSDLEQAQVVNDQLRLQADTPADKQPKNQDSKIVVYLAFILAQKLPKYRKSTLNINAKQIGEAITAMAQDLGLDKDDMHGFKRPDARLRTLINDNKELLSHFESLIKDNEKN